MSSTSTPAADAGGGIGFMGPYNGTINTVYGVISGEKEDATSGNSKGVLRFGVRRNNPAANMEAMRIDSSGNLLVGKTAANVATAGVEARSDGLLAATRSASTPMYVNRLSTDGTILDLRKDNTTVGSIGVKASDLFLGTGVCNLRFVDSVPAIYPVDSGGSASDSTIDIGDAAARFKDLYLSGGVYLGGTGSANLLDSYEEGTFTPEVADATTGGNTGSGSFSGVYTKVGNIVNVHIALTNITTSGMTSGNTFYVRNLPFATKSASINYQYTCWIDNITYSGFVTPYSGSGVTIIDLRESNSGAPETIIKVSDLTSGSADIYISGTYLTT
jgi:hypothetical protein